MRQRKKDFFLCFNDDELVRKIPSFLHFSVKINPIICALYYFIKERNFSLLGSAVGNEAQHFTAKAVESRKKHRKRERERIHLSAAV